MPYKLNIDEAAVFGKGKFVNSDSNTECVEFIRQATDAPDTTKWVRGRLVKSIIKPGDLPRGTVIATFDGNGKYPTDKLGKHAAIYLSHSGAGIEVLDQWKSQGQVLKRTIRFHRPPGTVRSNDADTFYVVN